MKNFLLLILLLTFSSCFKRGAELKHETGYVVEKQYFPDTKQTVTGTGFSSGGNLVTTTYEIGEDQKFIVVFKCDHGVVFAINKMNIYSKLNKQDTVTIDYYEMLDSDNVVREFDFIDANKITQ